MSWEDTFQSWGKPPGNTEQAKSDNAVRAIKKAIEASSALVGRSTSVFAQGSFRSRTNVRADSDVDVCILCSDSCFFDLPQAKTAADFHLTVPAVYSYAKFKNDVESALVAYFGKNSVRRGRKAFDIRENTYRVDADVVACFDFFQYQLNGFHPQGTAFVEDGGGRTVNWPEQNYENGVAKNDETGRRYKSIVRILKRLRNDMEDANVPEAKPIPSFLIECMVWNVLNEGFGHETYIADVRWVLAHLFNNTMKLDDCKEWVEVNDIKYLFRPSQPWTVQQAHAFVSAAWDYVGFQ